MKTSRFLALSLSLALGISAAANAQTSPQINEVFVSHSGTDDQEFIEIRGSAFSSLAGYLLLIVEGDGSGAGTLDRAWDLSKHTIPVDGFFVVGDNAVSNVDLKVGASDSIEDGTQTIYLVKATTVNIVKIQGLVGKSVVSSGAKTTISTLATIVDSIAVTDGATGAVVYDGAKTIGPNGSEVPAGIYRAADKTWCEKNFLDFDDAANKNAPRTPGTANTAVCAVASITVVGTPCGGTSGPILTSTLPHIGKPATVTITNAPTGAAALLFVGDVASKPAQLNGCNVYLNPTLLLNLGSFTFTGTTGKLTVQLPYITSALNIGFGMQAAVGTSTTFALTNGLRGNFGW